MESSRSRIREEQIPSPHELATIMKVDCDSLESDKAREGWIMSISKTFCGATAALMAADGNFGDKKMNATLLDVLEQAKFSHFERSEKIDLYKSIILARGWEEITMSELLSHRSGLIQGDDYFTDKPKFRDDNVGLFTSGNIKTLLDPGPKGKVFSYGNPTFLLAEELMGLAGDVGDYYKELKKRIIHPLELTHTKSIYESEESKKTASEVVHVKGVIYDWGVKSKEDMRHSPLEHTQSKMLPLSAGGLCSSIGDMEVYAAELSKMICGIPSLIVPDKDQAKQIHEFYRDAYRLGAECESDVVGSESTYGAKQYSLGVFIGAVDEKGNPVFSRTNPEARCQIRHIGNFAGNDANMEATMPFSFDDFESGRAAETVGVVPQVNIAISQQDVLAKHSLFTMVHHIYIDQLDEYFVSKAREDDENLHGELGEWRRYYQHLAIVGGEMPSSKWQASLTTEGRLPADFAQFHEEIIAAYAPSQQALIAYAKENFCDESGIIDSEKVKEGLKTAEDFEKVRIAIEPKISEAQKKVEGILARCDKQLKIEKGEALSWVERTSPEMIEESKSRE